jgi:hypothetical protein
MKRINKTFYQNDKSESLLSLSNGKAYVERAYSGYSADELDELASVCQAAAEELRSLAPVELAQATEAHNAG